ncbi:glycoside hydrolase family 2 protein [Alienimonas californiensis]|uniref:Beta-galactosidase n=1 Tax=Alienimonas californiensis TaxID=2527989 RepID=A0A517P8F5_9PLAN|nr:sugar-binding domain-containing protein [Alienimonas californiensis]QDT15651.1 Beta-galactosidase [Alienimonas californiensis]
MRRLTFALAALLAAACSVPSLAAADAPPLVDVARYAFDRPADGWQKPGFDASEWQEGPGGFGTPGTDGARVGTRWTTDEIWLRKTFELKALPAKPALLLSHDEDAEIYLNGEKVAEFDGYVTEYFTVPLSQKAAGALKVGENVLAVHCRQTNGGQFIDVHLVSADAVPKLPAPAPNTEPFKTELITKWGAEVTPENAWTEYPRPQMRREQWTNLNGHWDYAIAPLKAGAPPEEYDGEILVPYPLESKLSGVQRLLSPQESLWYRRTFEAPARTSHQSGGIGGGVHSARRTLLHFEAVDYRCEAWVNGTSVGTHVGGNLPFSFDVTDALNEEGENELVLRVEDATGDYQLRGKQALQTSAIFYTRVSGIWGTVWTETVPVRSIEDLTISTDAEAGTITVAADVRFPLQFTNPLLRVRAHDGDRRVAGYIGRVGGVEMEILDAKLWTPDSPHLYDLTVELMDGQGNVVDTVYSYAGIRDVGMAAGPDGHQRFTLNGETVFHLGPLDQGWWPDGLLTPPSDEAMVWEIEWLKSAGFNMLRKHIKVEPRRYYYHCDRLGIMVWQDQVSGFPNPPWTRLAPNPKDANWPAVAHAQYMAELEAMISLLESHPSIVSWVPFNEAWGQHRTVEVGDWTKRRDPSRIVNVASGGNWWPSGDVVDYHSYPEPDFRFGQDNGRFDGYAKVIGEYGGHGLRVRGHEYDPNIRIFSYGDLPEDEAEYRRRYAGSAKRLVDLKARGIAGGVYTQTTDVEGEINGLMTYDRKVIKIPAEDLAELHRPLVEPGDD